MPTTNSLSAKAWNCLCRSGSEELEDVVLMMK
jgi:hypothetical protein